ncbi:MAG: SDR family NAD(P)-dependent oxidoreductase [Bacteroidales bacterium]|jgi:NADP-dependent 3-hydroxy acid dehydrogenase YdfG|nr:SDR family NAD(P)-dependent oxidoreductase [Bacteroidales bacterium]MDD4086724.1 SDR family NAD(P)-dependent oxidoreductase [Bacteroidales bacterium]MDY0084296.1 SDR family NAD(P)-dependent oxidoreductase [Bacteroidales bacterium]
MPTKTAIITGATSGIGQAAALKFAANGWQLVVTGRRAEKLRSLQHEIQEKFDATVICLTQDVRHPGSGDELKKMLSEKQIKPDLLINNAGLAAGLLPLHNSEISDWEQMIDTNIKGLLYVSKSIASMMVEQGFGHIINIGSIAGKEAYPGGNVYCATKHAVDGLTKAMRMDLLPFGIRVSQVAPGAVETEFSLVRFKGDQQKAKNVYKGFKPLTAEDIADAIWYVANVPAHVNINDLLIMPTAQASAMQFNRQSIT